MDNTDFANIDIKEQISVGKEPKKFVSRLVVLSGVWKVFGVSLLLLVLFLLLTFLIDKSI